MSYYLTDGIHEVAYIRVKPASCHCLEFVHLKTIQELACKDAERALVVLQMHWRIIKGLSRLYMRNNMQDVMYACIILHNMIIEVEGLHTTYWTPDEDEASNNSDSWNQRVSQGPTDSFGDYVEGTTVLHNKRAHARLVDGLVEELWACFDDH